MEFAIILLPLLSYLTLTLFKNFLGAQGSQIVSFTIHLSMLILSLKTLISQILEPAIIIYSFGSFLTLDFFEVELGFTFDSVTIIAICVINSIATAVHLYSFEYMREDGRFIQFLAHLCLFVFSMLILVTASNLIILYIGWEGVGLCSYLLINHWYGRIQANKAAIKAMLMNRIGDCFLVLGFISCWALFGTFDLYTIFVLVPGVLGCTFNFLSLEIHCITLIGFFLFMAAVGKSAQIGLHTWLPDAMEGPTPVSALLHAATMVTAGVILLIRFSPLLEFAESSLHSLMLIVGSLTAFFGASTALFQYDIKRIIAFSTCSQLGLMIVAIGLSNYQLALFHFSNHAFFKALLFLSAGVIIHGFDGEQDIRRMGALRNLFPLCFTTIFIGSCSLIGFPFTSGFYSKDAIFENLVVSNLPGAWLAYFYSGSASMFTAAYSVRLMYLVFFGAPRGRKQTYEHAHENTSLFFLIPLVSLSFFSIFIGYLSRDLFIGLGSNFFGSSILNLHSYAIEAEFIHPFMKLIPLLYSVFAGICTLVFFVYFRERFLIMLANRHLDLSVNSPYVSLDTEIMMFFNKRWYFDIIYVEFVIIPVLFLGETVSKNTLDRGYFSLFGPVGFSRFIDFLSQKVNSSNHELTPYLLFILIFTFNLIFFSVIWFSLI